jgi:hypothetical protein
MPIPALLAKFCSNTSNVLSGLEAQKFGEYLLNVDDGEPVRHVMDALRNLLFKGRAV